MTLPDPALPPAPSRTLARLRGLLLAAACLLAASVQPAAAQLSLKQTWEGPIGYVTAAATLRNASNAAGACQVDSRRDVTTLTVSGIPAGATIRNAFLYWAGSGAPDYVVTFNGTSLTATAANSRTAVFDNPNGGTDFTYFGGKLDVTTRVAGNGTYSLTALEVDPGEPWCGSSAVVGGWALYVIYEHTSLPIRRVQLLDGLRAFRQATETVALAGSNRLEIAPSHVSTFTYLLYDGDPDLSTAENIIYNGVTLSNGTNPVNNPFNSSTAFGVDLDTWNATDYTTAGASSANLNLSVGDDMVILQAIITSLDTKGVIVTPDGSAVIPKLQNGAYSQLFVAENTSIIAGTFDLFAGTTGVMLIDSIRGPGIASSPTRSDSARVNLAAGTPVNYTVWYRVPVGAPVTTQVGMAARWSAYPTYSGAADTGYVNVRRVQPQLTLGKTVSPTGVLSVGTDLTYTLAATNVGEWAATGVVVADTVPLQVQFKLASVSSTLPAGLTAAVTYYNAANTAMTPTSAGCGAPAGYDGCVRRVQWSVAGPLQAATASSATFSFVARIK